MSVIRTYRAGSSIEDYCRACKTDRIHTVGAADADGRPVRVVCGFCLSEHNYRGGPRVDAATPAPPLRGASLASSPGRQSPPARDPSPVRQSAPTPVDFPVVSERERTSPRMSVPSDAGHDLELLLRRVIREETGITPVTPAAKWRGGSLVLRPGTPGVQEKSWPIETFFHKVVMLRNRLRTLEQQVNGTDLAEDLKIKLQGYISGCYGSLTSFNVLFSDEEDQFKGSGTD